MRTKLTVPVHEEGMARMLGADYDTEKKQWYVEDVEHLEPFLRWMDKRLTRPCKPVICNE